MSRRNRLAPPSEQAQAPRSPVRRVCRQWWLYWATADSPVTGTLPTTYLALVAACAVLVVATVLVFDRHDLR